MNILFWILQVILAWLCLAGGFFKIFKLEQLQAGVASMRNLPKGLWIFFGVFEVVAGLTLILPAAFSWLPILTVMSAIGLALESIIISLFYIKFRDYAPVKFSIFMGLLALVIAVGRYFVSPF